MTLPRLFVDRWNNCTACRLHETARSHVIGRGSIPADVLFIGEAPGRTEDLIGQPFVGEAGQLLNNILDAVAYPFVPDITAANPTRYLKFSYYITNVVACCPWEDRSRQSYRQPTKDEAEKCRDRLNSLIQYVKPKTIVILGLVAKKLVKAPRDIPTLAVTHPAAMLPSRTGIDPESSVPYHQLIRRIREHLEDVLK